MSGQTKIKERTHHLFKTTVPTTVLKTIYTSNRPLPQAQDGPGENLHHGEAGRGPEGLRGQDHHQVGVAGTQGIPGQGSWSWSWSFLVPVLVLTLVLVLVLILDLVLLILLLLG